MPEFARSLCLVTGGAGAIGSHLVESLLERGARVDVLDDFSSGREENLPVNDRLRVLPGDVTDPALAEKIPADYDYVFHLAAHFANERSVREPARSLEVNLLGTLNLLQHLRRIKLRRFIFASSSCVDGCNGHVAESHTLVPSELDTPYAISKFSAEALIGFWRRHYGLPAVILRYFNSYGPRDWPGPYRSVIPNFLARALAGEPLPITGTGDEVRDFTFVGDIVTATIHAAQCQEALGRTLNIGGGIGVKILFLAETINDMTGNKAGIIHLPARAWDSCRSRVADTAQSTRLLGLGHHVPLADGLSITIQWAKGRKDFIDREIRV